MTSFQERFKGKCTFQAKDGIGVEQNLKYGIEKDPNLQNSQPSTMNTIPISKSPNQQLQQQKTSPAIDMKQMNTQTTKSSIISSNMSNKVQSAPVTNNIKSNQNKQGIQLSNQKSNGVRKNNDRENQTFNQERPQQNFEAKQILTDFDYNKKQKVEPNPYLVQNPFSLEQLGVQDLKIFDDMPPNSNGQMNQFCDQNMQYQQNQYNNQHQNGYNNGNQNGYQMSQYSSDSQGYNKNGNMQNNQYTGQYQPSSQNSSGYKNGQGGFQKQKPVKEVVSPNNFDTGRISPRRVANNKMDYVPSSYGPTAQNEMSEFVRNVGDNHITQESYQETMKQRAYSSRNNIQVKIPSNQDQQELQRQNNKKTPVSSQNAENEGSFKKNSYKSIERNRKEKEKPIVNNKQTKNNVEYSQGITTPSTTQGNYTPYSLEEYKNKKQMEDFNYHGLGPNIDTDEWNKKKEKIDKMNDFSQQVKYINAQNLPPANQRKPKKSENDSKTQSKRDKAIEFSKNIPKPKQSAQQQATLDEEIAEEENELDRLEKMHMNYLNQIQQNIIK